MRTRLQTDLFREECEIGIIQPLISEVMALEMQIEKQRIS
jgi:hypothetical protein